MSTIGYGYGSEFHLLRFLGYHRNALNQAIEDAIPRSAVLDWLDFAFESNPSTLAGEPPRQLDKEFKGLDFLTGPEKARLTPILPDFWPTTGNLPNWDAVGKIRVAGEEAWLIVEAKSHLAELRSTCGAKPEDQGGGRDKIIRAFRRTQSKLGVTVRPEAWLSPYYQFCNRVAFLDFLIEQGVPTRLLFLYFLGDRFPSTQAVACPGREADWGASLRQLERHTGWNAESPLGSRVHRVFLPVSPASAFRN